MRTFTDNNGRIWTVVVNVAAIKRVRAICGIDINSIVEIGEDGKPNTDLLQRLEGDPVLLVDTLYAVCKPECDTKNVTDEDFGAAMAGDAIASATDALLEEIIDFFPEAKRLALRRILNATRRFAEMATKRLKETMDSEDFEIRLASELARLTGLSGNAQESAESSPTHSPSES